jgi:hypothetical protein
VTTGDFPPGTLRPIRDPQAEVERLARVRIDPPGRVWGVRHSEGLGLGPERVSVHITGQPFGSRYLACLERDALNSDCDYCEAGGTHTLVYRDTPDWRDE